MDHLKFEIEQLMRFPTSDVKVQEAQVLALVRIGDILEKIADADSLATIRKEA